MNAPEGEATRIAIIAATSAIVVATIGLHRDRADDLPGLIRSVRQSLGDDVIVDGPEVVETVGQPVAFEPAVSVRKSLASPDFIVSMIDGKPYKTLRRHLGTHGLTPETYRERYGLKADYPMVASNYSDQRRDMAKKIGLGRKPGSTEPAS